jgi:putative ABC transport system permease protein
VSPIDLLRFAAEALGQHRRRSGLSLLGVSIGVIAVISLTAFGEGAVRYVADQFATLGTSLLIVTPGHNETTGGFPGAGGVPNDLTLDDALELQRKVPGVVRMVPMAITSAPVSRLGRSRQVMVVGSTADFRRVRDLTIVAGRFLPADVSVERSAPVAVIGKNVARELFGEEPAVGQPIRVGDWRMRVLGVLASRGTQMGIDVDELVVVPVATGMRMANTESLMRILLELRPSADMQRAKQRVVDIMIDRHDEQDVTVLTQEAVLETLSDILRALTAVVASIAAISLTVAGIGIMNVMLVSVSERRSEVGLLKALGATRRQILGVFLVESIMLSSLGGAVGLGLGWFIVEVVTTIYPSFPAAAPLWAVAAVAAVSMLTGTLFGVLPAWRASRLDPVIALQSK